VNYPFNDPYVCMYGWMDRQTDRQTDRLLGATHYKCVTSYVIRLQVLSNAYF